MLYFKNIYLLRTHIHSQLCRFHRSLSYQTGRSSRFRVQIHFTSVRSLVYHCQRESGQVQPRLLQLVRFLECKLLVLLLCSCVGFIYSPLGSAVPLQTHLIFIAYSSKENVTNNLTFYLYLIK